ncbi:MAG TPA: hypothetical protein ENJ82_08040 [Bacteroidetes bacterium]|nr:hypothetical protein [Bacteroidota bacterium]
MKKVFNVILIGLLLTTAAACKKQGCTDPISANYDPDAEEDDGTCVYPNIIGYNLLQKLPGIWTGPVSSPTPLGSFPEWIVDFRPISPSQVSAKNELDWDNDIFMSFFICKYDNQFKLAFRNGGGFAGNIRISYMIIDSISEMASHSFYRFTDPVTGGTRVYTDVVFKGDSLTMHTFTNKFNTLSEPVTHMFWKAALRDPSAALPAISHFNFPQKELTKDFSTTFGGLTDAVFYTTVFDPYPESEQPYLGNTTINLAITNPITIDTTKKVLLSITTQPLFNGFNFIPANLKYRSRYVLLNAASSLSFNFNYMHPGDYYLNAIYDNNGDFNFSSGDYMNSAFDIPFTLNPDGTTSENVNINFKIP